MNLQLRESLKSDWPGIAEVSMRAFGAKEGGEIAHLISELLADSSARPLLSLVATVDGVVVGHILFTNAHLDNSARSVAVAILAPLSVHPEFQNLGIGGRLIEEGLRQLKSAGVKLVFVLGHPGYYPRYGFSPAGALGFEAPYPIAPENADAWMIQELHRGVIGQLSGTVKCAEALDDPALWQE